MNHGAPPSESLQFLAGAWPWVACRRLWKPALVLVCLLGVAWCFHLSTSFPATGTGVLTGAGIRVLAIFVAALVLWVTEATPLIVTGLGVFAALVVAQIPVETIDQGQIRQRIAGAAEVSSWYGDRVIFFLLGIFLIAGSLTASHVVDHLALRLLNLVGTSPRRLRQGVFWTSFFASWLMAEHAVAAMLFPVVARIRDALGRPRLSSRYIASLFLGLAWGCTIGGIVTYLGGARIALAMGIVQKSGLETPSFFGLMLHSLPIAIPFGLFAALLLEVAFPIDVDSVAPAREALAQRRRELGRFGPRQWGVTLVIAATVAAWAWFGVKHLAPVALASAAFLLATGLVTWREVHDQVPWDLLIMEGGALALCGALQATGSAAWAAQVFFAHVSHQPLILVALICAVVIALTELFSNPAVVTLLVPLLLGLAPSLGMNATHLALLVALPCGLSFILPLGSPPLAIAFAGGEYRVRTVMGWGVLMDFVPIPLFVAAYAWVWVHL